MWSRCIADECLMIHFRFRSNEHKNHTLDRSRARISSIWILNDDDFHLPGINYSLEEKQKGSDFNGTQQLWNNELHNTERNLLKNLYVHIKLWNPHRAQTIIIIPRYALNSQNRSYASPTWNSEAIKILKLFQLSNFLKSLLVPKINLLQFNNGFMWFYVIFMTVKCDLWWWKLDCVIK